MASWPTPSSLRDDHDKLKYQTDDDPLTRYITMGKNLVLSRLARAYDTSAWSEPSIPPVVVDWAQRMALALYNHKTHFSAQEDAGDRVGGTERQNVLDEIDDLVKDDEAVLLDDSGEIITRRPTSNAPNAATGTVLRRTMLPVFNMDRPERQRRYPTTDPRTTIPENNWR